MGKPAGDIMKLMSNPDTSDDVRVVDDRKAVVAELKRRGMWIQFQIAAKMHGQINSVILDKTTDPGRTDMFVRFAGHANPKDNGFMWISTSNNPVDPATAQKVFLEVVRSVGPIGSIEEIVKIDQLTTKRDQTG